MRELAEEYLDIQRQILEPWPFPKHVGSYIVKRPLANGGFSKVYLGEHVFSHQEVVLKCTAKTQPNLVSEIMSLRTFHHPNIIKLYEIVITVDHVWLVLEYCRGEELFNRLMSGPIGNMDILSIFSQLAGAVAYIHTKHHCAHRDLKLENVLLSSDGTLKLADFGFTRNYSSKSILETICGTTPYMAPELLNGEKYTPEAIDVWSMGIILYALIYSQLPFDEDNELSTKHCILKSDPAFGDHPIYQEHPALLDLLKSLLSKNPRDRPHADDILAHAGLGVFGQRQLEVLTAPEPDFFSTKLEKRLLKHLRGLDVDVRMLAKSVSSRACDPLHGLWYTLLENARHQTQETLGRKKSDARSLRNVKRVARAIVRPVPLSPSPKKVTSSTSSTAPSRTSSMMADLTQTSISQPNFISTSSHSVGQSVPSPSSPFSPGFNQPFYSGLQRGNSLKETVVPEEHESKDAEAPSTIEDKPSSPQPNLQHMLSTTELTKTEPSASKDRTRRRRVCDRIKALFSQGSASATKNVADEDSTSSSLSKTSKREEPTEKQTPAAHFRNNRSNSVLSELSALSHQSDNSRDSVTLSSLFGRQHRRTPSGGIVFDDEVQESAPLRTKFLTSPHKKLERNQLKSRLEAQIEEEA